MLTTPNYALKKIELTDSPPDITVLNGNFDTIDTELKENSDTTAAHLTDNLYQTAGGTGTAIILTIGETLVNGLPVNFVASANNSAAVTTINGKPLYKPNTTTAPNIISGKPYTVVYNLAGDCFFLKASAEGDATVDNVLAGKKFSNDSDTGLTGTMVNNGANNIELPLCAVTTIPAGYSSGAGKAYGTMTLGTNLFTQKLNINPCGTGVSTRFTVIWPFKGTVRIKFDLYTANNLYAANGQVFINDVAVGTLRHTTSTSSVSYTEDFTVNAGDSIQVRAWNDADGHTMYCCKNYADFMIAGI